jgi:sugar phosphate isomerase/epimerase
MKRIVGCNIGCNIVYPDCEDVEQYNEALYLKAIPKYKEYGFSHIEFSHVMKLDEASAGRLREYCRMVGIIPWSIHSEHLNAAGAKALKKYLTIQRHCCKVAKALDAKVVVCHIPNVEPRAKAFERDLDILTQLADITREYGLKLAIETPPYDYIIKLVDAIDRGDVGMNLDTGHTFLEGHDPALVARKIGKRLFTTHLQDNFGVNDDHQPPGLGKIDWLSTLTALNEVGYNGPLLMEMTGRGVKRRRSVRELQDFELEKELIFAKSYLEYLYNKCNKKN